MRGRLLGRGREEVLGAVFGGGNVYFKHMMGTTNNVKSETEDWIFHSFVT